MKKSIIISVVTILVLSCIIFLLLFNKDNNEKKNIPNIIVNKRCGAVMDEFIFSVENIDNDVNVTWDLGDGNVSYGKTIKHRYQRSDYFDVICRVDYGKSEVSSNITISVVNMNYYSNYNGNSIININPISSKTIEGSAFIFEGISEPIIFVNITINNCYGSLEILVLTYDIETDAESIVISKSYNGINQDIQFSEMLLNNDFPQYEESLLIDAQIILHNGRCGQWNINISVEY